MGDGRKRYNVVKHEQKQACHTVTKYVARTISLRKSVRLFAARGIERRVKSRSCVCKGGTKKKDRISVLVS